MSPRTADLTRHMLVAGPAWVYEVAPGTPAWDDDRVQIGMRLVGVQGVSSGMEWSHLTENMPYHEVVSLIENSERPINLRLKPDLTNCDHLTVFDDERMRADRERSAGELLSATPLSWKDAHLALQGKLAEQMGESKLLQGQLDGTVRDAQAQQRDAQAALQVYRHDARAERRAAWEARPALALYTPASLPSFLVLAWACLRRAGGPMGVFTASRVQSTCGGRFDTALSAAAGCECTPADRAA